MPALEMYRQKHEALKRAKRFLSHFTATGYQGSRFMVHSLGNILPNIAIQYSHCGQSYWEAKQECADLIPFIEGQMMRDFPDVVARAVASMEADMCATRDKAKAEFLELFGTEMPD